MCLEQHPIGKVERPLPAWSAVSDRVTSTLGDHPDHSAELGWLQPGERENPLDARRGDHMHPSILDDRPHQTDTEAAECPLVIDCQLEVASDLPDRVLNAEVPVGRFQPGQLLLELRRLRLQDAQ